MAMGSPASATFNKEVSESKDATSIGPEGQGGWSKHDWETHPDKLEKEPLFAYRSCQKSSTFCIQELSKEFQERTTRNRNMSNQELKKNPRLIVSNKQPSVVHTSQIEANQGKNLTWQLQSPN